MTLSEQIRQCRVGAVHNPFQGSDKRVLFVCSMGLLRSPTGARIYASKFNTRSCGVWPDALIPISVELVEWADEVVFVHQNTYKAAMEYFAGYNFDDKIKVLNISDEYEHMHPELIKQFEEQYESRS